MSIFYSRDTAVQSRFERFLQNPTAHYTWWYRVLKWLRYHVRVTVVVLAFLVLAFIFTTAEVSAPPDVRPSSALQNLDSHDN